MGAGSPKKPAAPRKRKKRAGPVSLHPLEFDTAMKGLLAVSYPRPLVPRKGKKRDHEE
jgi:hypothetical protein